DTIGYRLQTDCLEPFEQSIEDRLDLLVVEGPPPGGPSEHHLQAEDLGVVYVEDHELDTEPLLFEQVQINIPMKPLCRPECAGLCPHCGADLNAGACSCAEETDDTRWAALATLRDRLS
nr:DUF177 domain-containing protein [Thermoanaerobaculia bacterium]